jgi:tetratricopeptide (TPR) repeat protein
MRSGICFDLLARSRAVFIIFKSISCPDCRFNIYTPIVAAQIEWKMRYFVVRSALLILLFTSAFGLAQSGNQASPKQIPPVPSSADAKSASQTVSQQVADAEAAIVKSDWKTAETTLDSWLSAHPNDGRALFDAGYVADAQNRLDDAANLYRRATEADPKSFEAHLSLGLLLARQGEAAEARSELQTATSLDPGNAEPILRARAWRALAQLDKPGPNNSGNAAQASDELLEALKLSPETPDDTLLAASLAESAGQDDEAEAAYRRLLAKNPKSAQANAGLAHLLIKQKKYPEAQTLLRAALEQSPDDPALTAQLAGVLAAQDNAEALPLLQKLHAQHPTDTAITRMLADLLAQAGDAAGSDALYVHLLASQPDNVDLLLAHGQNLIRELKDGEAFNVFNRASRVDPENGDAWSGLAFAASKTGQPSVALHALTMRSKFLPEVPSTYFLWATSYDTMHDKTDAIAYYHQFLNSAAGKYPDQEWQARQRLLLLEKKN